MNPHRFDRLNIKARTSHKQMLALAGTCLLSGSVMAASVWTGGGTPDASWDNPLNWGGTAPASDVTTDIQLAGTINLSPDIGAPFTLRTLTFNAAAGSFVLGGSQISLKGSGNIDAAFLANISSNLQTINNDLKMLGPGAFSAYAGDMVLNGKIDTTGVSAGMRLNANVGKTLTVNGKITGPAAVVFNGGETTNNGTVSINRNNDYTGTTTIWHANVLIGADALSTGGAFGKSTTEIAMGLPNTTALFTPSLQTNGAYTVDRNIRIITSTGTYTTKATIGGATADVSTYAGSITLGSDNLAAMEISLTAASGGRVNLTGDVKRATGATGAGDNLNKVGGGIVALSGENNTYAGTTEVKAGTFLVNGALSSGGSLVSVYNWATLGGEGTISRAVSVSAGGILSPGDMIGSASSVGHLTLGSALALDLSSVLKFDLGSVGGSTSDQVSVNGDLALGGILDVNAVSGFGLGTYTLFTYTGNLTGDGITFGSMPTAGGYTYGIDLSNSGAVNLTVVPEPGAWSLFGIALLLFSFVKQRKAPGIA